MISGVVLHATDVDTPSTELVYELHSIPKRGDLQLKMVDDLEASKLTLMIMQCIYWKKGLFFESTMDFVVHGETLDHFFCRFA